jgi:hypothetical protein
MYLPHEMPNARVLITVKAYPQPSGKYDELVCTAGVLEDGRWVRVYPVPFRGLPYEQQYKKYQWVEMDLIRRTEDFRRESYRPRPGSEPRIADRLGTEHQWALRKRYVYKEVFYSMSDLIDLAKSDEHRSLGTLMPREIVDFVIEPVEREWKDEWKQQLRQLNLFDRDEKGQGRERRVVRKLPYRYYYRFISEGDTRPRKLMIEDWEIGALYWNCLRDSRGDEAEANRLVREKYFDEFLQHNDIRFFLGTTLSNHPRSPNPFVIVGVFYPPRTSQPQQMTLL